MQIKLITSIAIEQNGKFLIVKRSPNETFGGIWEFPGGKVEPAEKLLDSARRETMEETGLSPNKLEYGGYSERFAGTDEDSRHVIIHHFYCNDFKGEVKLSEEHTDFRWTTKDEILGMKVGRDIGTDTVHAFGTGTARFRHPSAFSGNTKSKPHQNKS